MNPSDIPEFPWHLRDAPVLHAYQYIAAQANAAVALHEQLAAAYESGATGAEIDVLEAQVIPALVNIVCAMGGAVANDQMLQDMEDALDICQFKTLEHRITTGEVDVESMLNDIFGDGNVVISEGAPE